MASKFIEKFIIVMIYFVIFIIMKVHGNDSAKKKKTSTWK